MTDITENKYYTPDISEFHVGFEFERHEGHRVYYKEDSPVEFNWVEKKWDESQIRVGKLRCEINDKLIRVKHIDHEDLVALGWIELSKFQFAIGAITQMSFSGQSASTLIYEESNYYDHERETYRPNRNIRFNGFIRNKSELARIMRQIGITK
ncbi:MAG: hypothetical protein V4651_01165 [Bacteroidota bacterium]